MIRVLALVEGPTERNFGQKILAAYLGTLGIDYRPRVIGKPGHKGGVGPWNRAKKEIIGLIRQEPRSVCTTMFDLYALPQSWPGRAEAQKKGMKHEDAARHIEGSIEEEIQAELVTGGSLHTFIAYLSLHEYEAMLFSDPDTFATVTQGPADASQFRAIVAQCGGCERIDDHPQTAPSRRIKKICRGYQKTVDGITAAERIGLETIRNACPHFNSWLTRLEALGAK